MDGTPKIVTPKMSALFKIPYKVLFGNVTRETYLSTDTFKMY